MARFSLYLVCGLVLGAVIVNAISQDPGYLLVTWGDWQVETSVWLALSSLQLGALAAERTRRTLVVSSRTQGGARIQRSILRPRGRE